MRLVCIDNVGLGWKFIGESSNWYGYFCGDMTEAAMILCYACDQSRRWVTVEAAREDYGINVPPC